MKYAETLAQDRRLAILKLLKDSDGSANESVLRDGLSMLGHNAGLTRQAVRDDLGFLDRAGLVRLDWFNDTVCVARITERGVDCAEGRVRIDGVKRPGIGI